MASSDQIIARNVEKVFSTSLPTDFFFAIKIESEAGKHHVVGTYEASGSTGVLPLEATFDQKSEAELCKEKLYHALINRGGATKNSNYS